MLTANGFVTFHNCFDIREFPKDKLLLPVLDARDFSTYKYNVLCYSIYLVNLLDAT